MFGFFCETWFEDPLGLSTIGRADLPVHTGGIGWSVATVRASGEHGHPG